MLTPRSSGSIQQSQSRVGGGGCSSGLTCLSSDVPDVSPFPQMGSPKSRGEIHNLPSPLPNPITLQVIYKYLTLNY